MFSREIQTRMEKHLLYVSPFDISNAFSCYGIEIRVKCIEIRVRFSEFLTPYLSYSQNKDFWNFSFHFPNSVENFLDFFFLSDNIAGLSLSCARIGTKFESRNFSFAKGFDPYQIPSLDLLPSSSFFSKFSAPIFYLFPRHPLWT